MNIIDKARWAVSDIKAEYLRLKYNPTDEEAERMDATVKDALVAIVYPVCRVLFFFRWKTVSKKAGMTGPYTTAKADIIIGKALSGIMPNN